MKSMLATMDEASPKNGLRSPFLTRREAAVALNVSEKWLAQSGRSAGPQFHKFGGHCRYHIDDLDNWVRQQKVMR